MANSVFNVALGRVAEKAADGATLKLLVLKNAAADAVLQDLTTVAAILANVSTDEADFTNYARATLAGTTVTVDHANDRVTISSNNVVFTAAGGAVNNTTAKAVIYEEVAGGDANCIPLTLHDAVFTTDGNNVTVTLSNGWYRATKV